MRDQRFSFLLFKLNTNFPSPAGKTPPKREFRTMLPPILPYLNKFFLQDMFDGVSMIPKRPLVESKGPFFSKIDILTPIHDSHKSCSASKHTLILRFSGPAYVQHSRSSCPSWACLDQLLHVLGSFIKISNLSKFINFFSPRWKVHKNPFKIRKVNQPILYKPT